MKIPLNERIVEKPALLERDKTKLPSGVLARVTYPVMRFGVKNKNNRVYERAVGEKLLEDKDIKEKLEHRTLFGQAEHPQSVQGSLEKTSHIISDQAIKDNVLYQTMDVLDTPYGRIVEVLLAAGSQVGVSTRADGELEEALDEQGNKYHRVIPEAYKYQTTDFTADPSTPGVYPESVERDLVDIVRSGLEANKIDQQYATVLLETMKTAEAVALLESIKKPVDGDNKMDVPAKESIDESKCTICNKPIRTPGEHNPDVARCTGHTEAERNKAKEPTKEAIIHPLPVGARIKFPVAPFEGKEAFIIDVLAESGQYHVQVKEGIEGVTFHMIFDKVEEVMIPLAMDPGKDGFKHCSKCKGYVEFPDQDTCIKCSKTEEKITTSADISGQPVNAAHAADVASKSAAHNKAQEGVEIKVAAVAVSAGGEVTVAEASSMDDAVQQLAKAMKEKSVAEAKSAKEAIELNVDVAPKVKEFIATNWGKGTSDEMVEKLITAFKLSKDDAKKYVDEATGGKAPIAVEANSATETKLKTLIEQYTSDVVAIATKLGEATLVNQKLGYAVKEQTDRALAVEASLVMANKTHEVMRAELSTGVTTMEAVTTELARLKEDIAKIKEVHDKALLELKEAHNVELMKQYVTLRVASLGLKLPKNVLTILEACKAKEEVEAIIKQTQDMIREGALQFNKLSEILVAGSPELSPEQADIFRRVGQAFKGLGS